MSNTLNNKANINIKGNSLNNKAIIYKILDEFLVKENSVHRSLNIIKNDPCVKDTEFKNIKYIQTCSDILNKQALFYLIDDDEKYHMFVIKRDKNKSYDIQSKVVNGQFGFAKDIDNFIVPYSKTKDGSLAFYNIIAPTGLSNKFKQFKDIRFSTENLLTAITKDIFRFNDSSNREVFDKNIEILTPDNILLQDLLNLKSKKIKDEFLYKKLCDMIRSRLFMDKQLSNTIDDIVELLISHHITGYYSLLSKITKNLEHDLTDNKFTCNSDDEVFRFSKDDLILSSSTNSDTSYKNLELLVEEILFSRVSNKVTNSIDKPYKLIEEDGVYRAVISLDLFMKSTIVNILFAYMDKHKLSLDKIKDNEIENICQSIALNELSEISEVKTIDSCEKLKQVDGDKVVEDISKHLIDDLNRFDNINESNKISDMLISIIKNKGSNIYEKLENMFLNNLTDGDGNSITVKGNHVWVKYPILNNSDNDTRLNVANEFKNKISKYFNISDDLNSDIVSKININSEFCELILGRTIIAKIILLGGLVEHCREMNYDINTLSYNELNKFVDKYVDAAFKVLPHNIKSDRSERYNIENFKKGGILDLFHEKYWNENATVEDLNAIFNCGRLITFAPFRCRYFNMVENTQISIKDLVEIILEELSDPIKCLS